MLALSVGRLSNCSGSSFWWRRTWGCSALGSPTRSASKTTGRWSATTASSTGPTSSFDGRRWWRHTITAVVYSVTPYDVGLLTDGRHAWQAMSHWTTVSESFSYSIKIAGRCVTSADVVYCLAATNARIPLTRECCSTRCVYYPSVVFIPGGGFRYALQPVPIRNRICESLFWQVNQAFVLKRHWTYIYICLSVYVQFQNRTKVVSTSYT